MAWALPGLDDRELDRALVNKGGLYKFLRLAWPVIVPTPFVPGWHVEEICAHLEAVSRGEIRKLIVNVPPGMSKSLTVSVIWPVWDWLTRPDRRFMFASFDPDLSGRDALLAKELLTSEWFQDRWGGPAGGVTLHEGERGEGKRAAKRQETNRIYWNNAGGFRFSTSVGSKATGWHAHIQVVDDPIKPADTEGGAVATRTALEKSYRWWASTMASRKADPEDFSRVIIMQRLHEADLCGRMIAENMGYTLLRLPMRFEASDPCRTIIGDRVRGDRRTVDGELLCPERYSLAAVKETERDMGPMVAAAQLQQRPSPLGGAVFQRDWFVKRWRVLPSGIRLIQSWDCSFKDLISSDFVAGAVWGAYKGEFFLVDQIHDRMSFTGTKRAIRDMLRKWPGARTILVEDKANGTAIIDSLKSSLPGIVPVTPQGSKISRAYAVSGYFEAGNVYLPHDQPWVGDYIEEMVKFPTAKNDDRVDHTTQALIRLTGKHNTDKFRKAMQKVRSA